MANNRMYLVHRPSGFGAFLGKRMGAGWYDPPPSTYLECYYDLLEEDPDFWEDQDDFIIVTENDTRRWTCKRFTKNENYFMFKEKKQ